MKEMVQKRVQIQCRISDPPSSSTHVTEAKEELLPLRSNSTKKAANNYFLKSLMPFD
jgi:hypothetical protein